LTAVDEGLAQRVLAGKDFLGRALVDDGDVRRILVVVLGEVPALQQRDAHDLKVVCADDTIPGRVPALRRGRPAGDGYAIARVCAAEWQVTHERRPLNAGLLAQTCDELAIKEQFLRRWVGDRWQRDARRQNVRGIETGRDLQQAAK